MSELFYIYTLDDINYKSIRIERKQLSYIDLLTSKYKDDNDFFALYEDVIGLNLHDLDIDLEEISNSYFELYYLLHDFDKKILDYFDVNLKNMDRYRLDIIYKNDSDLYSINSMYEIISSNKKYQKNLKKIELQKDYYNYLRIILDYKNKHDKNKFLKLKKLTK